jgi:hypothetical protein
MARYKSIPPHELGRFFNAKRRTMFGYQKKLNMHIVYYKFCELKTLREQKKYLYSFKNKVSEEILDHIWERYTERLDEEYWTPKENKESLYLWAQM